MSSYLIKEVFGPTIQGEGSHSGTVVKFIRFSACNRWSGLLKDKPKAVCWFCDTDFRGGERLTAQDIVARLEALDGGRCKTVVLSGGEATLQLDAELLQLLRTHGYRMHLETNGSKDIAELADYFDHVTVSPKQSLAMTKLKRADDLKLLYPQVIDGVTPHEFAGYRAEMRFLQPVDGDSINENTKKAVDFCLHHPEWRISLQTHKILGVQ